MTETLWACQAPPHAPSSASPVWRYDLVSPAAITFSRTQLRRHVGEMSLPPGMDDADLDALLLTYEELASNAIRHGRLPVLVTVTTVGDGWMIDVVDSATECAPVPTIDRDPADGGLGLHLVARLCTRHGWWTEHNRKHVWACIHSGDRLDAPAASGAGEA